MNNQRNIPNSGRRTLALHICLSLVLLGLYLPSIGSHPKPPVSCPADGTLSYERWDNITGWEVGDLTGYAAYPSSPDFQETLTNTFEISNAPDFHGARISGYLCPPQTGTYTFWIASDDQSELWLSTNSDPANASKIAEAEIWTNPYEWNKFTEQQSVGISLVAGQIYYIEALVKDNGGGNHLAVGWELPDGTLQRPAPTTYFSASNGGGSTNQAPTASASANPLTGTAPLLVSFDADGSTDPDGDVLTYTWDFGDGNTGNVSNASNTFSTAGTYSVVLTVDDGKGGTDTESLTITVSSAPPPVGGSCNVDATFLHERWDNLTGWEVGDLISAANYPNSPDLSQSMSGTFEAPLNGPDNHGSRISAYLCPPQTGEYIFWIASDDQGELWLSTDSDPANLSKIAEAEIWTNVHEWDKFTEQQSAPISLVAGQIYYIEALMKDAGGGNHLSIGWELPDGTQERPMPATNLSSTLPQACVSQIVQESMVEFPFITGDELLCGRESRTRVSMDLDPNTGNTAVSWIGEKVPGEIVAPVYLAIIAPDNSLIQGPIRVDQRTGEPSETGAKTTLDIDPATGNIAIAWVRSTGETGPAGSVMGKVYHRVYDPIGSPLAAYVAGEIQLNTIGACSSTSGSCYGYIDHFDVVFGENNQLFYGFQAYGGGQSWARFPYLLNRYDVTTGTPYHSSDVLSAWPTSSIPNFRSFSNLEYVVGTGLVVAQEVRRVDTPSSEVYGAVEVEVWDVDLTVRQVFPLSGSYVPGQGSIDLWISSAQGKILASWIERPTSTHNTLVSFTSGLRSLKACLFSIDVDVLVDHLPTFSVQAFTEDELIYYSRAALADDLQSFFIGFSAYDAGQVTRSVKGYTLSQIGEGYQPIPGDIQEVYSYDQGAVAFYGDKPWGNQVDWNLLPGSSAGTYVTGGHAGKTYTTLDNDWVVTTGTISFTKGGDTKEVCERHPLELATPTPFTNRIISRSFRTALGNQVLSNPSAFDERDVWENVAYFDGLGRPIQSIAVNASPDREDVVQMQTYDAFGRSPIQYLPFNDDNATGELRSGALALQQTFYGNLFPGEPAFAESVFEPSPLNRVIEQGAPGESWQVIPREVAGISYEKGHTVKSKTLVYGSSGIPASLTVPYFALDVNVSNGNSIQINTGHSYATGADADLIVSRLENENEDNGAGIFGAMSFSFTDQAGRLIMSSTQVNGTDFMTAEYASTFYLYDAFGRVKYVLQPEGFKEMMTMTNPTLTEDLVERWAFEYIYDERGRQIAKRVPGSDFVLTVYDKLDRVIMTQDGNQGAIDEWLFTKNVTI